MLDSPLSGGRPMRRSHFGMKTYRIPGDWEITLFLGPLQIRLGNMQQAAWWLKPDWRFVELFNTGARMRACRARFEGVRD